MNTKKKLRRIICLLVVIWAILSVVSVCLAVSASRSPQKEWSPDIFGAISGVKDCHKVVETPQVQETVAISEPVAAQSSEEAKSQLESRDLYIYYIDQICEEYYPSLDPAIVKAVAEAESSWNPNVQSHCGAVGLMQVIPKYHSWRAEQYGLCDIWDPYTNLIAGADFLNESYALYGNYYQALLRYNNSSSYANYVMVLADKFR